MTDIEKNPEPIQEQIQLWVPIKWRLNDDTSVNSLNNKSYNESYYVPFYEKYEVSNYGNVRNRITKQIYKLHTVNKFTNSTKWVNNIMLRAGNVTQSVYISHLVISSFLHETYIPGCNIYHIDRNKQNNYIDNLKIMTIKEIAKTINDDKKNRGEKRKTYSREIIRYKQDDTTGELVQLDTYESITDASNKFNVSNAYLCKVCRINEENEECSAINSKKKYRNGSGYIWKYAVPKDKANINKYEHKSLEGFPNYYFTKCGQIYSIKHQIMIKPDTDLLNKHSHHISLYNENGNNTYILHRIIAQAWIPNPFNLPVVKHRDGDMQNNHSDNLYWSN
jgi:hypothetical protein